MISSEYPDFFGLKALQKEPVGPVSVEKLKKRASRQYSLKDLLGQYAVFGPVELRERICYSASPGCCAPRSTR